MTLFMTDMVHQMQLRRTKDEDDDEEDMNAAEEGEGNDEGEDNDLNFDLPTVESNLLTEFHYKFDQALRQPSRGLLVKDLMILFDPESVYGRRTAFHKGLMVTAPCLLLSFHIGLNLSVATYSNVTKPILKSA